MWGLPVQITDGNIVTVPASLDYLSTYVLLEQEDWFEKELPFVRRLLQPGMRALDIGANYGLYSAAMGKKVGPTGRVWAFEPSKTTFRFLHHTLAGNGLAQVDADDCALSDRSGTGRLSQQTNSELNSLLHGPAELGGDEVRVDTLDGAAERRGIQGVDFIKLDAEGEEARIVAGGRNFLQIEDPLVMFELKHGHTVNTSLLTCFRESGYRIFRLVGPSTLLVPVENESAFDEFELNLFACKEGRAGRLEHMGLLLTSTPPMLGGTPGSGLAYLQGERFAGAWPRGKSGGSALQHALDAYALWRQPEAGPARRYGALLWSLQQLEAQARQEPSMALLSLLARVAYETGSRSRAVQIINVLLNEATKHGLDFAEPTWPAAWRYDSIPPSSNTATWSLAATAEAMVHCYTFSGYFSGASLLTLLDWLHASPYASAPMERRRQLQQVQSKRTASIQPSALLSNAGSGHRNAEFWRRAAAEGTTMPSSLVQSIE